MKSLETKGCPRKKILDAQRKEKEKKRKNKAVGPEAYLFSRATVDTVKRYQNRRKKRGNVDGPKRASSVPQVPTHALGPKGSASSIVREEEGGEEASYQKKAKPWRLDGWCIRGQYP